MCARYMVGCESQDKHKDTCSKEIGVLAQILLIILDAVNLIEGGTFMIN